MPYNDVAALKECFAKFGHEIAGVIIEPVAGNMNMVKPIDGFLQAIRDVCDEYKSVFIIDEVMTGFRVALGGAQSVYNVKPDLTTLGKIIGAGLENALTGKTVGDKFTVNVPAAEGYGEYNPDLVQEVPAQMFQGVDNIQPGMQFQAQTDDGVQIVTVKAVEGDNVIVDANFPLAGQDLTFEVEIVEIREASQEELDHGHVHGAGGHHH
ncbi:aminotransferase class III-fold pyridoxal phosphate-dependent enzyme [Acinetobacter baumannii]